MKTNLLLIVSVRSCARSLSLLGTLVWLASALTATATSLHIAPTGNDIEGLQTFRLEWDAVTNATYRVQSATDLAATDPWKTVDVATPANGAGLLEIKGRSISENSVEFFRLILPQPQIFSVEPAIFPPGVAVDAYVIGQCFESNDVVRVDGVGLSGMIHLSNNMLQGPLPTLSVGLHVVELVRGGVVQSSFTVTCADALANPELALQGPPTLPLASPIAGFLSKRGYDYYKAQSDNAAAGLHNNPYFKDNQLDGEMPRGHDSTFVPNIVWDNRFTGEFDYTVAPASGELAGSTTDLVIPGRGLDFIWARTYHSRIGRGSAPNGWTFSYDLNIQRLGGDLVIHNGTGRADTFKPDTNGVYTCPEFFSEGTTSNETFTLTLADGGRFIFYPFRFGAQGKLTQTIDRNGNAMSLNYDTAGRLAQVVDDLDRTNTVAYDTAGRLASVTDFSGRTVTYAYYELGETGGSPGDLKSVTSPPVTGTPNGNDFPLGKTTTYTYSTGYANDAENHLLLSVIDAAGQTVRQHVYQHNQTDLEFLRCISVQHWTNTPTILTYLPQTPTPSNQFATLRCIVNNPVGNVTECFYDARNRCVKLGEFTGYSTPGVAVTDTVNRPTGHRRQEDTDVWWRTWNWNNDSLCTLEISPGGQQVQCVYESDFDKSARARKRADCRVVREIASSPVDLDGDGVADVSERVSRYEYDSRFGSSGDRYLLGLKTYDPTKAYLMGDTTVYNNTRTRLTELENVLKNLGLLARSGNVGINEMLPFATLHAAGKTKRFGIGDTAPECPLGNGIKDIQVGEVCDDGNTDCGDGFVISATDPRGIVTTTDYDSQGNAKSHKRKNGAFIAADYNYAYNTHGQLTTITNAPDANGYRRVDTISYFTSGPQTGYPQSIAIDEPGVQLTTAFEYDVRGNVTRYVDPRTNDWLFTYNALDQCVRARSPINLNSRCTTDYFYDANDNLLQSATEVRNETDALLGSKVVVRGWDAMHRLTRSVRAVDATHSLTNDFVYDDNGQCVQVLGGDAVSGADPHQTVTFQYDERGLLFREIAAPGSADQSTTQLDYDANGNLSRVSEGLEGTPSVTTMEYDGFADSGSASSSIRAMRIVYVDTVEISIPSSPATRGRDVPMAILLRPTTASLRVSNITDPMGNVTTFNYDANDNLKVIRHFSQTNDVPGTNGNIRLAEARYDYDGLDRRRSARNAFYHLSTQAPIGDGESTTTFAYAPNGRCTSITDDLGHVTSFAYDTADRVYSVSVPAGKSVTACLRDQAGNVTSVVQTDNPDLGGPPQVFARTNVYDSLNRLVRTTDNVGNTNRYAYDSLNRLTVLFNPKEYTRTFAYDLLDRCTLAMTDLDGDGIASRTADVTATATWSSSSARLLSTADSHTNITSYGYDSLGRCTSVTNADGTRHAFAWSPRGNLTGEQDANGTVTLHTYDLNDRCTANQYMPGAGVSATTTFEQFAYDGCSRLVAAVNNGSVSTFAYDSLGNRTRDAAGAFAAVSTFDSVGNRHSLTYPGGRAVTSAYDVLDQVTSVSSSTGGLPPTTLATFAYAGPGRLARTTRANGVRTDVAWNGLVSPPNAPGDFGWQQVSRVNHTRVGNNFLVDERTFKRDRNQNTSSRVRTPDSIRPGDTITLTYDPADRLVDSIVTSNGTVVGFATYGLDRMGNRTNINRPFCAGNYLLDFASPPADFQMNQYTATPCDARTYDANGNLTSASTDPSSSVNYAYDCLDRLVAVANSGVPVAAYAYDALGRRISKSVSSGGLPPVTTTFLYDGDSVIEERSGGAVTATYVGDCQGGTCQGGQCVTMSRAGQDYYFHTDDLGNTVALVDAQGAPVEFYNYEDYGQPQFLGADGLPLTGSDGQPVTASPLGNPFLFHGMRWDEELLYFYGHSERLRKDYDTDPYVEGCLRWNTDPYAEDCQRYYDPKTGRAVRGKVKTIKDMGHGRSLDDNNPWSGGSPSAMQKGTVKFFNEAKGFGRMSGGGGGSLKASDGKKCFDLPAK